MKFLVAEFGTDSKRTRDELRKKFVKVVKKDGALGSGGFGLNAGSR